MSTIDVETKSVIESVIVALERHDLARCVAILEAEIRKHNENTLIDFFLKSVLFWRKRIDATARITLPVDKASYLLSEWTKYRAFCDEEQQTTPDFDRYLFLFRKTTSKMALMFLTAALNNPLVDEQRVYLYMARCYKGAGNYEQAIAHYRQVIANNYDCAAAYAELGDCYLLIGNEHIGRLFLREAFYVDPDTIEFTFLESELLANILNRLRDEENMDQNQCRRWLAVYAVLWDVLTVKRDLKTAEYGMLRQKIYAFEREYSETQQPSLEPRLLYAYFYLLDYITRRRGCR